MTAQSSSVTGWKFGIVIAVIIVVALQYYNPSPDRQMLANRNASAGINYHEAGKWVKEYLKCGHSVIQEENIDTVRLAEILNDNPGVQVQHSGQTTILVSSHDDYCPADNRQRYMGVWEDYLAIFRGPVGNGEMERITQIRVDSLPVEWQEQLWEGKLVFENELLLLEALDSLDEYQS